MKFKLSFSCAALALLGVQAVQATPVCTTASMAAYIAQGTCAIGNITFSFGSNAYIFAKDDINVSAAQVTVTPVGTGLTPNSGTGFTFTANNSGWTATNPDSSLANAADVNITYTASITLARSFLNSATLAVDPTLVNYFGDTGLLVGEGITDLGTNNNLGGMNIIVVGNTSAESISGGGTALTSSSFFSSRDVLINKDINILALDGPVPAASASLSGLTETLTYGTAPEPGAFVLAGFGLAVLLFRRSLKTVLGLLAN
jgi:hypothetical protein